MKIRRPTLHVSILSLFMVFLIASVGTLTWFNYEKSSEAALEIADSLMSEVNDKVLERIDSMFGATFRLAHETTELPQIQRKPEFMRHDMQWFMAESLLVHPHVYSVYIGYDDGDFFQIVSLRYAKDALKARFKAPKTADLAVRRVFGRPLDGRRIEMWQFFDAERRMVGSRAMGESSFDPRERPWYEKAMTSDEVIFTPIYVFTSTKSMGLTFARRFDGPVPGVFGVDVTLDELSSFFRDQHIGESGTAFMFNGEGRLTACPDPGKTVYLHSYRMGQSLEQAPLGETGDPLLVALSRRIKNGAVAEKMQFEIDRQKYLMRITPVNDERLGDQYVAVAALETDFTGSIDRTRDTSRFFALIICLLAVPVAMYFSGVISRPLRKLAHEADEIRNFNLGTPIDINSSIVEIHDLTEAVKTMKSSLSTFGRYVPKALVRQLLLSRLDPEIGGEHRELTLLFSDIADFTRLSEGMAPEELMVNMSEYLQALGAEMLKLDGTIDKFIGDAIMAFWNAPIEQENHAALACEAALRARGANEKLNEMWEARGVPRMRTRFGLHSGDTIVGNVGSDDRMNYTAIGSAVNLASRLEGLNKHYGTDILVSESVRELAGDRFVFRTVSKVMPKGTTVPVTVYELLGFRHGEAEAGLSVSPACHMRVREWEQAMDAYWEKRFAEAAGIFRALSASNPDDTLATMMKEKTMYYDSDPSGENWNGIDIFKTK